MNILSINSVNYGSTGNIMLQISEVARNEGFHAVTSSAPGRSMRQGLLYHWFIGTRVSHHLHLLLAKFTGCIGCYSILDTVLFLRRVNVLHPNLIHLHNLHYGCINLPILFHYIKKHRIPIVWTLHDCWAFTGHCPYFTLVQCDKWKAACNNCPIYQEYPKSSFDNSKFMWKLKKKWFTGVEELTIVTPSKWLANLVKQSFLKEYPVRVIHNGIDLNVFKPTPSDFREKHGIGQNKKVLLGVAYGWSKRKGLDVFLEIASRLDDQYRIVLVGTNETTDKLFSKNIISIHNTQNQVELAEIYTTADVFVNPTREEVLGLVNIEALACGTPVITFRTGGSPECVDDKSGIVVEYNDIDTLEKEIVRVCETRPFRHEDCIERAKLFDKNVKIQEYIKLYNKSDV